MRLRVVVTPPPDLCLHTFYASLHPSLPLPPSLLPSDSPLHSTPPLSSCPISLDQSPHPRSLKLHRHRLRQRQRRFPHQRRPQCALRRRKRHVPRGRRTHTRPDLGAAQPPGLRRGRVGDKAVFPHIQRRRLVRHVRPDIHSNLFNYSASSTGAVLLPKYISDCVFRCVCSLCLFAVCCCVRAVMPHIEHC